MEKLPLTSARDRWPSLKLHCNWAPCLCLPPTAARSVSLLALCCWLSAPVLPQASPSCSSQQGAVLAEQQSAGAEAGDRPRRRRFPPAAFRPSPLCQLCSWFMQGTSGTSSSSIGISCAAWCLPSPNTQGEQGLISFLFCAGVPKGHS